MTKKDLKDIEEELDDLDNQLFLGQAVLENYKQRIEKLRERLRELKRRKK